MDRGPLHDHILASLAGLPAAQQDAARVVLDRPQDVALMSMRELARSAGVQPASLTRFAQSLGLSGYDALRAAHAEALRGLSPGAGPRLAGQQARGPQATAEGMVAGIVEGITALGRGSTLEALTHAASAAAAARRVHCLGRRACHPVAFLLDYLLTLAGIDSRLLEGAGGTGGDALALAGPGDLLIAISVSPYAAETLALARTATAAGVQLVALTDSAASPLATLAGPADTVVVLPPAPGAGAGLLPTLGPALAAAETLAALAAGLRGQGALDALARTDAHLAALKTHLATPNRKPR